MVFVVLGSACGDSTSSRAQVVRDEPTPTPSAASAGRPDLYEATGTVLESHAHGPELCLGVVLDSLPPQCGGIPLSGWDWEAVDGEERAAKTVWGDYRVTGVYHGETFTVSEVGAPAPPEEQGGDPVDTACAEPAGGWTAVDPARASQEHASRAAQVVRKEPDFGGVWVDSEEGSGIILNAAFTGSLERHERELRELWGGPVCLVERDVTYDELRGIQRALNTEPGLEILWSSTDETSGTVEVGVVVLDTATRSRLDDKYGEGVVEVHAQLRPVE